jgi:hypothetical protein
MDDISLISRRKLANVIASNPKIDLQAISFPKYDPRRTTPFQKSLRQQGSVPHVSSTLSSFSNESSELQQIGIKLHNVSIAKQMANVGVEAVGSVIRQGNVSAIFFLQKKKKQTKQTKTNLNALPAPNDRQTRGIAIDTTRINNTVPVSPKLNEKKKNHNTKTNLQSQPQLSKVLPAHPH